MCPRHVGRSGKAPERVGEYRFEEAGGRGGTGQGHPSQGNPKKLLSPVMRQSRSTQHRQPHVPEHDPRLVREMVRLAEQYGRYGYRQMIE